MCYTAPTKSAEEMGNKDTGDGCGSESQGALSSGAPAANGFIAGGIVDRLCLPVKDGVQRGSDSPSCKYLRKYLRAKKHFNLQSLQA